MMNIRKCLTSIMAVFVFCVPLFLSGVGLAAQSAERPRDASRSMHAVAWQIQLSESNLVSHNLPLHIASYEPGGALRTDEDVALFQRQLIDDGNFLPVFDGVHPESFRLMTFLQLKQQIMLQEGKSSLEEVVTGVQKLAFPLVRKKLSVMTIVWEYQGLQFRSQCVYDSRGVVYDNILSNMVFVRDAGLEADQAGITPGVVATYGSITKSTHPVNINIYWIWGSLRGHINVYHYAQITNGLVVSQWGQYDGWMTLGTASGNYHDIELTSYYAKAQWAYGWATPFMTVSITWNSDRLKFDISITGLGSSGSGQGTNVIYP